MHRGPRAPHSLGWDNLQSLAICVPPQSLYSFPRKARGHKDSRPSNSLPREKRLDHFYITIFPGKGKEKSSLLDKKHINGPLGLRVFPHLLGPNSNLGVTFKFFKSFIMTTILFIPCLGVLGGVAVFHLRNFCGW